jgi:hypothetical protein
VSPSPPEAQLAASNPAGCVQAPPLQTPDAQGQVSPQSPGESHV